MSETTGGRATGRCTPERGRAGAAVRGAILALGAVAAPTAGAEVISSGPAGFVVRHEAVVKLDPAAAYQRLLDIGSWWDGEHTYSGKAANLSLDATPGGCWCETIPAPGGDGFIEHMRVIYAMPGKTLRLAGGLGPVQSVGASGVMTYQLAPADGGGTKVTMTYAVGGYDAAGFEKLKAPVDGVLGAALKRFAGEGATPR